MKTINYFAILLLILFSCKGKEGAKEKADIDKGTIAVCMSDGVPVTVAPEKGAKYLTSLNLGETMIFLGEIKAENGDAKKEYYKVELTDGSIAWARSYGIALGATPATITAETPVYQRPDLVNKTNKVLYTLEFVAILSEKDDWVEIAAANKKKSGWIKKQNISTAKEDVAVSTLAVKTILTAEGKVIEEKVPDFIIGLPYSNTVFQDYLQKIADDQVGSAIEQAVEEYEENTNKVENIEGESGDKGEI